MPLSRAQTEDILRRRLIKERAGEDLRPLAVSGLPDASAEFGGGPQAINNPFVAGATGSGPVDPGTAPSAALAPLVGSPEAQGSREVRVDPASGQQGSRDFAFSVNQGEGDAASARIARGLLANGQFQDQAHKQRLEQIIKTSDDTETQRARADVAGNASELKRQQQLSDFQFKKLVEAGADPKNPLTVAEFDQVAAEIHRNSLASTLSNPTQIRRRFEEADNPAVDVVNTSSSFATSFGGDANEIQSLFGQPAKGKQLTTAEKLSVAKFLQDKNQSSPARRSAVNKSLSRIDKEIKEFKERSNIFDDAGNLTPETTDTFAFGFGTTPADVEADQAERAAFAELQAEQTTLAQMQRGFVGDQQQQAPAAQPTPAAQSPPAIPAGSPAVQNSDPAQLIGATQEAPIVPGTDDSVESIINQALALSASQGNRVVYIQDPDTGDIFPLQAN